MSNIKESLATRGLDIPTNEVSYKWQLKADTHTWVKGCMSDPQWGGEEPLTFVMGGGVVT